MTDREKFEVVSLAEVFRRTHPDQAACEAPGHTESAARPTAKSEPAPALPNVGEPQGPKAKIMVVDDEHIIADSLAAILRTKGYEANALYDAESALAACDGFVPECLISDVVMPGMNGFDLAVTLKGRFPECRILLFSGQAATVDMLEVARKTGYEFELLTKPVHPTDLLARLETCSKPISPQRRPMSGTANQKPRNADLAIRIPATATLEPQLRHPLLQE